MDPPAPVELAREAATAGAARASSLFREDLTVRTKSGKTDVVTRADREAQRQVLDRIRRADTAATVIAEESSGDRTVPETGRAWIVDPIDGTNNYVRGIPLWATAVALVSDREPVAAAIVAPELDQVYLADSDGARLNGESITVADRTDTGVMTVSPTFWWPPDRRGEYGTAAREILERFGDLIRLRSAQLTLAQVASGALDATFTNRRMNPWDSVAGAFLVDRAGGTVTDLAGDPWTCVDRGLVASSGGAHEAVRAAAGAVEAVRD